MAFQDVSGLDVEAPPLEYRSGDSTVFSMVTMPGIKKTGNVTMKKGIFKSDDKFWETRADSPYFFFFSLQYVGKHHFNPQDH